MEPIDNSVIEAARKGADLYRPSDGEDPSSQAADVIQQWLNAYTELETLERELLDVLATRMPGMSAEARREAEETNVPLILSQIERFRHRRGFWQKRKEALKVSN